MDKEKNENREQVRRYKSSIIKVVIRISIFFTLHLCGHRLSLRCTVLLTVPARIGCHAAVALRGVSVLIVPIGLLIPLPR